MPQDKKTLSPAEWQSVSDYVVELSQRMSQASSSPSDSQIGNSNGDGGNNTHTQCTRDSAKNE